MSDDPHPPQDKTLAEREGKVAEREQAVRQREELATAREQALSAHAEASKTKAEFEALIVELREANERLVLAALRQQTLTDLATQANRIKEQFLPMLAHELRNPLAPILNAVALMHRLNNTNPQLAWIHDVIKRQIGHMTRLLDDLLDLSRITSGKIFLRKRPVTVGEFVAQATEISQPVIDAHHQRLTVKIPATPLRVDGDPERLAQVFSNLLNNASKYTQDNGAIILSAEQSDTIVVLRVIDNGSGIGADVLPHIFELFTQEQRSLARSGGGLGIGLAVVRNLVELHGGTVDAHSGGLDQGSEFVVTLPLMLDVPAKAVADVDAKSLPSRRSYRIVIIEDNVDASDTLQKLLQMAGHQVSTAFDGAAGVRLVQDTHPQIVLCDIGLPGMDGYAVITQLREQMKQAMPFMIALTGYGQAEDVIHSLAAGFEQHLVKPVAPEALLQLIDTQANEFLNRRNRPNGS